VPRLSVIIPVYNEEQVLPTLFERLYPALDALAITYECVFVNDGSKDRSAALLRQQFQRRPKETRVVLFHTNFGQHSAVMAGLSYARGDYVITLDADLQNPPEEIGKLVAMLDQGYDYVGTIRTKRQDSWWRKWLSKGVNKMREWITPVRITDQGCMMRGYSRLIVQALNETREVNTFIPALASLYAMNPIEVPIAHEERHAGKSKYSLYSLIRLNFDLITGFSVVPLQLFSMVGMAVSGLSALLVLYLFVRRLIIGPEAEGLFTLFGVVFFFIGLALFGIGLLGEYVGRIYAQVRERPRYLVEAVLEESADEPAAAAATAAAATAAAATAAAASDIAGPDTGAPGGNLVSLRQ
jgi:undecaprenyl-phosphate 4-deoxy-4-formamido-L-arabinose transferase